MNRDVLLLSIAANIRLVSPVGDRGKGYIEAAAGGLSSMSASKA